MSPRGGPPPPESPCLLVFWTLHSGWRQSAVAMALKLCTCLARHPPEALTSREQKAAADRCCPAAACPAWGSVSLTHLAL